MIIPFTEKEAILLLMDPTTECIVFYKNRYLHYEAWSPTEMAIVRLIGDESGRHETITTYMRISYKIKRLNEFTTPVYIMYGAFCTNDIMKELQVLNEYV